MAERGLGAFFMALCVVLGAPNADVGKGAALFNAECTGCHGVRATGGIGPDLTRGTFRTAVDDDSLFRVIATGIPGSRMPGATGRHSTDEIWQLVTYVRSLAPADAMPRGDQSAGQRLFDGRARCSACHAVNGRGGNVGPDLTNLGPLRAGTALRAVLDANRAVRVITVAGAAYNGRRMDEDTFSIRLLDESGTLRSFERSTVRSIERLATGAMHQDASSLDAAEIDDLVAYLSTPTK
jgi:putative heme-binding domain-containing protein